MKKITLLFACLFFISMSYSQNTCSTAVAVTPGITTVGTIDGTAPSDCTGGGDADFGEWYVYTATADLVVTISTNLTANAGGDTRVHIYTGPCTALTCLASNDDVDDSNYLSEVSFVVSTGMSYYIAFDDFWDANGFDFELTETIITCNYTTPYTEVFDDDNQFVVCYTQEDVDGDGISWISQQDLDLDGDGVNETFATNGNSTDGQKDDWLISPELMLTAGTTYNINSRYNTFSGDGSLEAFVIDAASSTANQLATLFSNTNITPMGDFATLETMAYEENQTFTPATTGNYHIAYHSFGPASSGFILLFESKVEEDVASVEKFNSSSISHFYSSTNDRLELKSSTSAFTNIELYDIIGKSVLTKSLNKTEESVDLSSLNSGVYIAKIAIKDAFKTVKFVKD